jgi:hypothetical protein
LRLLSGVKRKLDFELRRAASGAERTFSLRGSREGPLAEVATGPSNVALP